MKAVKLYTNLDKEISIEQINKNQVAIFNNNFPVIILDNTELEGLSNACLSLKNAIEEVESI